jgi:hypothetical protein
VLTIPTRHYDFRQGRLRRPWHTLQQGGGQLAVTEQGLLLATAGARPDRYSNAQIHDYSGLARQAFPWQPPLTLTVRARFGGPIAGTAGFGFWNNPISREKPHVALPAAIWFLWASPPSDIRPTLSVPGSGWKAACLDLTTPQALAWAPLGPAVLLANQVAPIRRRLWPYVEQALRVAEHDLGAPDTAWHTYQIEWRRNGARFLVDGAIVLESERAPVGPLGLVAWVDTQYLVATPRGQFWWGLLDAPQPQSMLIESLHIEQH